MDIREAGRRLAVDKSNLDGELEGQPLLYFETAQQAALARERREICKVELSLMIAEVVEELREQDPKIAENRALREAEADPSVSEKRMELVRLVREEAEWSAFAQGAGQKSHTLTALATLYSNSYYVRDSVSSSTRRRRRTADEV